MIILTWLQRPREEKSLFTVAPSAAPDSCIITIKVMILITMTMMVVTTMTTMTTMTMSMTMVTITMVTWPRQKTVAPSPTLTAVFGIDLTTFALLWLYFCNCHNESWLVSLSWSHSNVDLTTFALSSLYFCNCHHYHDNCKSKESWLLWWSLVTFQFLPKLCARESVLVPAAIESNSWPDHDFWKRELLN